MAKYKKLSLKGAYVFKDLDWDEQNEILKKFLRTIKKVLKFSETGTGTSLDTGQREYHFSKKLKGSIDLYLNVTVSNVELFVSDYKDWNSYEIVAEFDFLDPDLLKKIANVYYSVKSMM